MRATKYQDIIKRNQSFKFEIKRILLKAIYKNYKLSNNIKFYTYILIKNQPKNLSFTQVRNICNYTYRTNSVFKFFGIERYLIRQRAMTGDLNYILYRVLS